MSNDKPILTASIIYTNLYVRQQNNRTLKRKFLVLSQQQNS
ncbi:hypothetical protein [Nostoc sp.]